MGASWSARRRLGAILGRVGAILERFGRIWEGFGGVLEAFWDDFWKLFCHLEQKMEIVKNLEKPMENLGFFDVFHNFGFCINLQT